MFVSHLLSCEFVLQQGSSWFEIEADNIKNLGILTQESLLIFEISQSLDTIKDLRGVTYKWKSVEEGNVRNTGKDDKTYYGFIAQEITSSDAHGITFTDRDGFLGLNLSQVVPILVNAVKELEERVTELENK